MATQIGKTGKAITAVSPHFGTMSVETYNARINTPARNPEYFGRFHAPLVDKACKERERVTLMDIACGPAQELDFFKGDTMVELIGVDYDNKILQTARGRLPNARFYCWDVRNNPPLPLGIRPGSIDIGIALNAVVYVPHRMLAALKDGLAYGGRAAVNFRIHGNPFNNAFYRYYTERGGVLREGEITVPTTDGRSETFSIMALDYTNCDDREIRKLVIQMYFSSRDDVERLIDIAGFAIEKHEPFHFASPVNPDNEIDVYIIRKGLA